MCLTTVHIQFINKTNSLPIDRHKINIAHNHEQENDCRSSYFHKLVLSLSGGTLVFQLMSS